MMAGNNMDRLDYEQTVQKQPNLRFTLVDKYAAKLSDT